MIDPFANDSQSMQIGELVIENQQDKVIIYGDIDIHRTAEGLKQAQQLYQLTGKIVQALQNSLHQDASNPLNEPRQATKTAETSKSTDHLSENSDNHTSNLPEDLPLNQQNKPQKIDNDSESIDNPFL